jgi:putative membrane protein
MLAAFALSAVFLIMYVVYHTLSDETHFGGQGWIRPVYYFLLITHIILAAVILPLILITLSRGLQQKFDKHRKIAKITLPLWLYVTVTGVIVYFMIAPYYH